MGQYEFKMPDIGEGLVEGEIVKWHVKDGDSVKEEDPFVEVMTDKATVQITAPVTGRIVALKAKEGQVVAVGSVITVFETAGDVKAPPSHGHAAPAPAPAKAAPAPQPAVPPAKAPAAPQPEHAPMPAAAQATGSTNGSSFVQATPGKVLAAPATRRRAREMGVDLAAVPGTGPRGRVMNEDLNRFMAGGAKAPAAASGTAGAPARREFTPIAITAPGGRREERIPFRGLRRKIAEAMARSKHTAAHFTYVEEIDVTALVKLRAEGKELLKEQGISLTYLPFIMKAVVAGLKAYPALNASLDETTQEIVIKHWYNLGIAVDSDAGLIVPVVKDVDQKSIAHIAHDVQTLAGKVRDGKIGVEDLKDGTFTITNAGNIGGLMATPVINFPEVAIVGVHKISRRPVVRGEQIVIGDVMWLSISIDHRLVDGATGARFMNVVKDLLEHPTRLLLGAF